MGQSNPDAKDMLHQVCAACNSGTKCRLWRRTPSKDETPWAMLKSLTNVT